MSDEQSITIDEKFLTLPEEKSIAISSALVKKWLSIRSSIIVNRKPFSNFVAEYNMGLRESYSDTRAKRLALFIEQQLLQPLISPDENINNKSKLYLNNIIANYLSPAGLFNLWQTQLEKRFQMRDYIINSKVKQNININTLIQKKSLEVIISFDCYGDAIWKNNDWDEGDVNDPQRIVISDKSINLYSGSSSFILRLTSKDTIKCDLQYANASLYAKEMRKAFITPTLDEQINQHLDTLVKQETPADELSIIKDTREYYLNNLTEQELQYRYINTNFYQQDFMNSKAHKLIEAVLREKPFKTKI